MSTISFSHKLYCVCFTVSVVIYFFFCLCTYNQCKWFTLYSILIFIMFLGYLMCCSYVYLNYILSCDKWIIITCILNFMIYKIELRKLCTNRNSYDITLLINLHEYKKFMLNLIKCIKLFSCFSFFSLLVLVFDMELRAW